VYVLAIEIESEIGVGWRRETVTVFVIEIVPAVVSVSHLLLLRRRLVDHYHWSFWTHS